MNNKKYIAEFVGTMILVIMGCGTAMLVGCNAAFGSGYILTALAFGLSIVALAYSIGNISGCHVNPAVSLAMWIDERITFTEFLYYCIAQFCGAFVGSAFLAVLFNASGIVDMTAAFGSNSLSGVGGSALAGFIVEVFLTFVFVMTILGVTSKKAQHGSFGGLVIGLTLTLVHILGIGLTGTSVNPARSFGPAITAAMAGNLAPLRCLWVFILAPFVGAIIAACFYRYLEKEESVEEKASDDYDEI